MNGRWSGQQIVVDAPAREQLYASSGMGSPRDDQGITLTWVEAAYLLQRGDLTTIDGEEFLSFIERPPDAHAIERWMVYRDLRARGYYVSTAYEAGESLEPGAVTFAVKPRGANPTGDAIAFRVAVVSETTSVVLADLDTVTLGVADDEGEITYIGVDEGNPMGKTHVTSWDAPATHRSGRRHIVSHPPPEMIDEAFFGQYLDDTLMLNPLEARYLAERALLDASAEPIDSSTEERRYRVYEALRNRGCVPRSGFKFGADFRVYTDINTASDPGHSSFLVEVRHDTATATPRTLSRAVRLAGGVRKQHLIALVGDETIRWISLERRRP